MAQNAYGYVPGIENYISGYGNAGPSSVTGDTIANNMSPYMSQYVSQALAPQLKAQQDQFDAQNRGADSAATGAGAFGNDPQAALYKSNLSLNQDLARQGLVGSAYNSAFNTAIGAGAQDVANKINVGTTNANLNETALGRQLGAATALEGAGNYGLNAGVTAANLNNQFGAQQTAQQQAKLNATYNQWLMAQQYPFQTAGLVNQTVGASNPAMGSTTTDVKSAPDNSGYALLGTLGGAALNYALPGAGTVMSGLTSSYNNNSSLPAGSFDGGGAFADGGRPPPGKPSLVGERGPELFIPDRPGTIVSNENSRMIGRALALAA